MKELKTTKILPCFIDFEASSLGMESYPIEVAWSTDKGSIENHFIKPEADWGDWSDSAELIHGISRQDLTEDGKSAKWIAERMNHELMGKVVFTNAYDFDWGWCSKLFNSANENMTFTLGDSWLLMKQHLHIEPSIGNVMLNQVINSEKVVDELNRLSAKAWQLTVGKRHRASVDVKQMLIIWNMIKKGGGNEDYYY